VIALHITPDMVPDVISAVVGLILGGIVVLSWVRAVRERQR